MKVYERLYSIGQHGMKFSYCGKNTLEIEPASIKAVGQMFMYGDFVTRWFVLIDDGQLYFFKAGEQGKAEQRWLRTVAKMIKTPRMTREVIQAMPVVDTRWMAAK